MNFKDLKIGLIFFCNGTKYKKVSTRTAINVEIERVFYFSMNDQTTLLSR